LLLRRAPCAMSLEWELRERVGKGSFGAVYRGCARARRCGALRRNCAAAPSAPVLRCHRRCHPRYRAPTLRRAVCLRLRACGCPGSCVLAAALRTKRSLFYRRCVA
jgi:hypothetical protein